MRGITLNYSISNINKYDIENIIELVNEQGWQGYNKSDIQFIINVSGEETCFKLKVNDEMSGMILSLYEDDLAYVSFFLVRKGHRNVKYALELSNVCMKYLKENSKVIIIYANPRAVSAYGRHGFKELFDVRRFQINGFKGEITSKNVTAGSKNDIDRCIKLNLECYKKERFKITNELFKLNGSRLYLYTENNEYNGYAFVRINGNNCIIGPLVALNDEAAVEIIKKVKEDHKEFKLIVEAPEEKFTNLLERYEADYEKLEVVVKKMYCGDENLLENDDCLYVIGGHHFS